MAVEIAMTDLRQDRINTRSTFSIRTLSYVSYLI